MTRTLAVVLGALAVVAVAVAVAAVVSQGSGASVPARIAYVTGGSIASAAAALHRLTGGSIASAQVWLADAGGGRRHHLGNGTNPLLSPDGRLVAASSGAASVTALSVFWASGGAPRRFFTAARVTARPVAFSPDSRYLAVVLAS